MEGHASRRFAVLCRDTRDDVGMYSELESEMGQIRGEEKVFDTDGFLELKSIC